ncbi:MAG: right-handed parallel beta-helix repeat-containing protein [Parcubacteria group bacterium]
MIISNAKASSYDYYVDSGYSGNEEGTKSEPFNTISEAIEASGSDDKIFIKKGDYDEKITIGKGRGLYGESESKVSLSGGIEMKDDSSINNLTVEGGYAAVSIDSDASAEINSCTIKKFGKIGIDALPGSGRVVVKNSSIYGGDGKGMYIELGRKIEISGNDIYSNGEEGIDVRAKVSGFIKNNSLHNNGESGIEIIIGSSDVLISGNNIKKNGASGIAAQFYQETKKTGELNIKSNTIIKNEKYGLDCALPSGGKPDSSYWSDSINLVENNLEDNGIKSINDFCNIIDAVDEVEEDVANKTNENDSEPKKEETLTDEEVEEDEAIWENAETVSEYQDTMETKVNEQIDKINAISKIKLFFFGVDHESLDFIRNEIEISKGQLNTLKNDLSQVKNEETKNGIQTLIEKIENKSNDLENFVKEKENRTGMGGWLLNFMKRITKF